MGALMEVEKVFDRRRASDYKIELIERPWKRIEKNKISKSLKIDLEEEMICKCNRFDPNPCGPDSECHNRSMFIECGDNCPAEEKCGNKSFQNILNKPLEVIRTSWGGNGLKSLEKIKRGEFVVEYVGEMISLKESKRRLDEDNKKGITNFYQISLDKNRIIDSGREGNISRFMNHSCNPNCTTTTWSVGGDKRIGIFSIKDIEPDEELTFNYQLMQAGNRKTKCLCKSENCAS